MEKEQTKNYNQATIDQQEQKLRGAIEEAERRFKQGREQVTQWATDVDKQVKSNPWPVVAGAAIGGLLLGVIIGKTRN